LNEKLRMNCVLVARNGQVLLVDSYMVCTTLR